MSRQVNRAIDKAANIVDSDVFGDEDEKSGGSGGLMGDLKDRMKNSFKDKVKEKANAMADKLMSRETSLPGKY